MSKLNEFKDGRQDNEFARQGDRASQGLLRQLLLFVKEDRNWFLIPIIVMLLLFGALVILSTSAAAPFIYALF